jgi:hypothetical protein
MAWSSALTDLRTKLSDGPTDRIRAFKRVFGQIDGSNKVFKTYEFRRVTDFTSATGALGVYLNGTRLLNAAIASDDLSTGFFTLVTAPSAGDILEATYYNQYFLDAELTTFLTFATQWLGLGDDYNAIPSGLRPCALYYALGEGYAKLAVRFSESMSETYRLEDMPDVTRQALIEEYKKNGEAAKAQALQARNEFYSRQGQHLQPLFGSNLGHVRDVAPKR